MKYKIGQIIALNQDTESKKALFGEEVVIPKSYRFIIGADGIPHHIYEAMFQPLGDVEVEGYDTKGLAEYLLVALEASFPLDDMLADFHIAEERFKEEIEYALDDIGF